MKNTVAVTISIIAVALAMACVWERSNVVHADSGGQVFIDLVPLDHGFGPGEVQTRGSAIVGFTCVANSAGNSCYVASR